MNLFSRAMTLLMLGFFCGPALTADLPLERIKLPPGFAIETYARVPGARSLALGANGTVFVGTLREGKVFALTPSAKGVEVLTLARDLNAPGGVAYRDGALYVADVNRVLRYDRIDTSLADQPVVAMHRLQRFDVAVNNFWHHLINAQ